MDTWLTIASRREVREYAGRPVEPDVVERILQAGRVAGNALNRQQWRFVVLESRAAITAAARGVTRPANVEGAALCVAVVLTGPGLTPFDAGRAAQNMMLAAANFGVGSCPNTTKDLELFADLLSLGEEERVVTLLSFGYPARARALERRDADAWAERADRKPLNELVTRI
jgi:nitroreductase